MWPYYFLLLLAQERNLQNVIWYEYREIQLSYGKVKSRKNKISKRLPCSPEAQNCFANILLPLDKLISWQKKLKSSWEHKCTFNQFIQHYQAATLL